MVCPIKPLWTKVPRGNVKGKSTKNSLFSFCKVLSLLFILHFLPLNINLFSTILLFCSFSLATPRVMVKELNSVLFLKGKNPNIIQSFPSILKNQVFPSVSIADKRTDKCPLFLRALAQSEKQMSSFCRWTLVTDSIDDQDNCYSLHNSI